MSFFANVKHFFFVGVLFTIRALSFAATTLARFSLTIEFCLTCERGLSGCWRSASWFEIRLLSMIASCPSTKPFVKGKFLTDVKHVETCEVAALLIDAALSAPARASLLFNTYSQTTTNANTKYAITTQKPRLLKKTLDRLSTLAI